MSKNRAELKSYFVKNAIPTESQFAELIESSLSQVDDGVFKRGADALGVAAATGDEKRVLGLYATPTATGAEWTVCLNPKLTATAPAGKPGFGINDGAGNSRLFIDPTGNVGIGTNEPKAKLDVAGEIKTSGAITCGNSDLYFSRTDHNHSGIGNQAGWAAIENAKNYDALMITGRMSGTTRKVRMWDWVQVDGNFRVLGNAGIVDLEGANHAYIQWFPKGAAAGRKGWIGYGSSGTDTLSITNEAAGGVQINGTLSVPGGIIFEGAVPHMQRDGALYRNTDGQCYLAVDDNLYIRIGSTVGAQFGAGGSFFVSGDITIRGARLRNGSGWGLLQANGNDWLRINPDSQFPSTAIYNSVATNGGLSVGDWSQLASGHLNATGKITTGELTMSGAIFQTVGRMHLTGPELLYLLHKDGVIIGKEWGGNGNLSVEGTKNFQIDHPLDKGKDLVHAALEGPEAAVMYRGVAELSAGRCVITLPRYFEALTRPEDRSVLLTPLVKDGSSDPLHSTSALAAGAITRGKFTVYALDDRNPSQAFYWEAKGVRADVDRLVVEPPKRRRAVGPAPQVQEPVAPSDKQP